MRNFLIGVLCVAGWFVSVVACNEVISHLRWEPIPAPSPVVPDVRPDPKPGPKPDWFGWRNDGGGKAIAATMPRLSKAAPQLLAARDQNDTRPILLYKAWTDLFSTYPPYPSQEIGDCTSFGHAHANDLLQCVEWCLSNPGKRPTAGDIQETDTEFLYGTSREIAGILSSGDGCYGAAVIKAMTTVGMVSRRMLGADGAYSGTRAKRWGHRGVPPELKIKAARYKLGSAANVMSWDELVAALANGNPVTICTSRGFSMKRDAQGFCRSQGTWGHCMFIAGIRFDRPGACVVQSWGPDRPSGPTDLDQPGYSFWADQNVIEAILQEGDCWALSKSPHFGAASKHRRAMPHSWREAKKAA